MSITTQSAQTKLDSEKATQDEASQRDTNLIIINNDDQFMNDVFSLKNLALPILLVFLIIIVSIIIMLKLNEYSTPV